MTTGTFPPARYEVGILSALVRSASQYAAWFAVALFVLAAAMTVVDVFMRSIVGKPLFGTNDLVILAMTVGVCASFPYATVARRHMSVDILGRQIGGRAYWALEFFGGLFTLLVFAGFAWQFGKRAVRLEQMNEGTQLLLIPLWPFWWGLTVVLALAALAQAVVLADCLRRARAGAPVPDGGPEPEPAARLDGGSAG